MVILVPKAKWLRVKFEAHTRRGKAMVVVSGIERSEERRTERRDKDTWAAGAGAMLRQGVVKSEVRHVAFDVMAEMSRNWLWNQRGQD